ncbi:MAG: YceD family protein [Archangium sp.]
MAHAPDGLGSGLASVPADAEVALDLRFEAVTEGVLVTGSAVVPLTGECARCLDPLTSSMEVSFQELYRNDTFDFAVEVEHAAEQARGVLRRLLAYMARGIFTPRARARFLEEFPEGTIGACAA